MSADSDEAEAGREAPERWWALTWAVVLAALLLMASAADCARAEVDVEGTYEVEGPIVTEAEGEGAVATTAIRNTRENARVTGRVVRNVVIKGNVETRATGTRSNACTSIGSIGGCGERPRGGRYVEIGPE
jgi:hypothetical protein